MSPQPRGTTAFSTVQNKPGVPSALMYYGLPANTDLTIPDGWIGSIYAPSLDMKITGGIDISGSLAARSFTFHGNVHFHYDEALATPSIGSSIRVTSWTEL